MISSIIKIHSQDRTFLDFYGMLAHDLQDAGTVYTPYPLIPPNARMAIPSPDHVLVYLHSAEAFNILDASLRTYLGPDTTRTLTLSVADRAIVLSDQTLPESGTLRRTLLPEANKNH